MIAEYSALRFYDSGLKGIVMKSTFSPAGMHFEIK